MIKEIFIDTLRILNEIIIFLIEIFGITILIAILIFGYEYGWNFSKIFYDLSSLSNQELLKIFNYIFFSIYLICAVFKTVFRFKSKKAITHYVASIKKGEIEK